MVLWVSEGLIWFFATGSNLINLEKKFLGPIFWCRDRIFFLTFNGILGIITNPSVKALK